MEEGGLLVSVRVSVGLLGGWQFPAGTGTPFGLVWPVDSPDRAMVLDGSPKDHSSILGRQVRDDPGIRPQVACSARGV